MPLKNYINASTETQWLWFIAILALLLNYFFSVAQFPLTDLDEGAYSGVTREMFVRQNWLSTYLNGEPWFEKPILMYWMQSLGVLLFGVNEWGFRIPSAVATALWVWVIYRFVAKEVNASAGVLSVIVTLCTLGTTVVYKAAIPDPFLNLFLTITIFDIYRYWQQPKVRYIYRAFLFMGLGVLAKGPIAIILPCMIAGLFFLIQGQLLQLIKAALNPVAWFILLLIVIPWHWYQYHVFGDAFIQDYFFKHNVGRFTSSLDGHAGNLFFYLFSLFLLAFPFWKPLWCAISENIKQIKQLKNAPLQLLLCLWFLSVISFFTFASTKLPHYLMYGMVPVFILIALQIDKLNISRWGSAIAGCFFTLVLLGLPFLLEKLAPQQDELFYRDALKQASQSADASYLLFIAISLVAFIMLGISKLPPRIKAAFCGLLVCTQTSWLMMPTLLNLQQQPLKEAAHYAVAQDISPVMWAMNMPSFSVYAQRITPKREPAVGEWVITQTHQIHKLGKVEKAFEKGGITLAKRLEEDATESE